jgi:hypothetical protein
MKAQFSQVPSMLPQVPRVTSASCAHPAGTAMEAVPYRQAIAGQAYESRPSALTRKDSKLEVAPKD